MQFNTRAAKSHNEKEIAKEQYFQKNNAAKNYHIKTAKPDYKSNFSKRTDRDEKERLLYNYKFKIPYTKLQHWESRYGKAPHIIQQELQKRIDMSTS